MYEVIRAAIMAGDYKLEDMLNRIRSFAARGLISTEEMDELEELARMSANVRGETDVFEKLLELERRIRALEEANEDEPEEYPPYKPGVWYRKGDRVSENGINYVCIAPDGVVCTWSPTEYPAYWQAV
jgi:hypothetical protein